MCYTDTHTFTDYTANLATLTVTTATSSLTANPQTPALPFSPITSQAFTINNLATGFLEECVTTYVITTYPLTT